MGMPSRQKGMRGGKLIKGEGRSRAPRRKVEEKSKGPAGIIINLCFNAGKEPDATVKGTRTSSVAARQCETANGRPKYVRCRGSYRELNIERQNTGWDERDSRKKNRGGPLTRNERFVPVRRVTRRHGGKKRVANFPGHPERPAGRKVDNNGCTP